MCIYLGTITEVKTVNTFITDLTSIPMPWYCFSDWGHFALPK